MLRLPPFRYRVPRSVDEAIAFMAETDGLGAYVAGGTDLYPKMKRRQMEPATVIAVPDLPGLGVVQTTGDGDLHLGAGARLAAIARSDTVRRTHPALARAAGKVATPLVRNAATLGGNLCLDTRCTFYDQTADWRAAIHFCMKKDGEGCRVAPSSSRCWAIQSSDTSPLMIALDAAIELAGPRGARTCPASGFYRDDGIRYLEKEPDELVTGVRIPALRGAASYVKVSRRLSFDFPVLGVALRVDREAPDAPVENVRLVLGALGSAPVVVEEAAEILRGRPVGEDAIEAAAEAAWRRSRPLDNADEAGLWRKTVVRPFVRQAFRELGGAAEGAPAHR